MACHDTMYGLLKDITYADYFDSGAIRRCIVTEKSSMNLPCGTLLPQYREDGKRKRLLKSLTFYEGGTLESVILQDIVRVETKYGELPAEMVTFYESGAIKRIFPSFGTISAFWTEQDEYEISPEISLELPFGLYCGKAINVMFYETGELKSITLWSKDSWMVPSPQGQIQARIGFSLYRDGGLRSVEPQMPVSISTPIGIVPAYDPDALGIDGDHNSLTFSPGGNVASLLTSKARVSVTKSGERIRVFAPSERNSEYFDGKLALEPMKISFSGPLVRFGNRRSQKPGAEYSISEHEFLVESFATGGFSNTCEECFG